MVSGAEQSGYVRQTLHIYCTMVSGADQSGYVRQTLHIYCTRVFEKQ